MSDIKQRIDKMVAELKQERDELHVRLNLAKMEAGDEWKKMDAQLGKLEAKAKELGGATAEASQEISAAAKLLGEEIRDGLKKVSQHF